MKKEENKKEVMLQTEEQKVRLDKLVQENLSIIYYLITTNAGLIYRNCNFTKFKRVIFPQIHLFDIYDANELALDLEDENIRDILDKYRRSLLYLAEVSVTVKTDTRGDARISTEDKYERNIKVNKVLDSILKRIDTLSKYHAQFDDSVYDFFEQLTISIIIEIDKEKIRTTRDLLEDIFLDVLEIGGIYNEE